MEPPMALRSPSLEARQRHRRKVVWWFAGALVLPLVSISLSGCSILANSEPYRPSATEACSWPVCAKSCEPCVSRRVGRCTSKLMGFDLRYLCGMPHTECKIGRCVCESGFCAGDHSSNGLLHGDFAVLRSCVPQACIDGARPPEHWPNIWVRTFASLALPSAVRSIREFKTHWFSFAFNSSAAAVILLITGLIVSITSWVCLCSGHGCCHGGCGMKLDFFCCGAKCKTCTCVDFLSDEEDEFWNEYEEDDDETHSKTLMARSLELQELRRKRREASPSTRPIAVFALFIAAVCYFSVIVRQLNWQRTMSIVKSQLTLAAADSERLAAQGFVVNKTVTTITHLLQEIQVECRLTDPLLTNALDEVTDTIGTIRKQIATAVSLAGTVPRRLADIRAQIRDYSFMAIWIPILPQLLVGFMSLMIALPTALTKTCRHSRSARCVDLSLMQMGWLVMVIILVSAIISALEVGLLVAISCFCIDVDHLMYAYADTIVQKPQPLVSQIARFYIYGDISNPVIEYVDTAEMLLDQVLDLYKEFKFGVDLLALSCSPIFDVDVNRLASTGLNMIHEARLILQARTVWPYYNSIVHVALCNNGTASIGGLIVLQVVVCLILFPLSTLHAHQYLVQRAFFQEKSIQIQDARRQVRKERRLERRRKRLDVVSSKAPTNGHRNDRAEEAFLSTDESSDSDSLLSGEEGGLSRSSWCPGRRRRRVMQRPL